MLIRLSLVLMVTIAFGVGQPTGASPITYDFTGTLGSAFNNGTNQFSGSFTVNGDPTVTGYPGSVNESGSDVSLTLKMGGQVFNYVNPPNSPTIISFNIGVSPSWSMYPGPSSQDPSGLPYDEAILIAAPQWGDSRPSFGMTFYNYDPWAAYNLGNLRNFNLPVGSGTVDMSGSEGLITSIELVPTPTPEPSTLAIFAVLGVTAMAYRHRFQS